MLSRLATLRLPERMVVGAGRLLQGAALLLPLGAVGLAWQEAQGHSDPLRPEMVRIEPGTFTMGSPVDEADRQADEGPVAVTLTRGFWLARTEVTQAMYERVMGEAPFIAGPEGVGLLGDDLPAQGVSWEDALRYCNRLSALEGLTPAYDLSTDPPTWNRDAEGYRLPTEAEWEYAARAGTTTRYLGAAGEEDACGSGNYADESTRDAFPNWQRLACDDRTVGLAPVASFVPNRWWLYDMGGNVQEWVWDAYANSLPGGTDPAVDAGASRVYRGGSWYSAPLFARVAYRRGRPPSDRFEVLGFRPARSAAP